ncbi:hypothetical protein L3Q82_013692 [Scortum barcoo]|uniref:Uncharacterized protein n=1 Tax=Scortum barcoo TaxID=214431 RepID=A0ACB8W1K4_9TELE|nr:hypothetical protein L3Q82_013692 [Scortum barcoo]
MAAELGSYKQAHTSSPPLTLGNSRVVEGPAPLKELGSRAQAMRGGIGSSRPPATTATQTTLHRPLTDLPAGGEPTGRRAHVRHFGLSPAGSRGQRPSHQALSLRAPTPGLAPGWGPGNANPGDVTAKTDIREMKCVSAITKDSKLKVKYPSIYYLYMNPVPVGAESLVNKMDEMKLRIVSAKIDSCVANVTKTWLDNNIPDATGSGASRGALFSRADRTAASEKHRGGVTVLSTPNTIVKFADNDTTTVVGLISDNDETHYREEIQHLTQWCSNNNLVLNTSKTNEVIVDYRRSRRTEHAPLLIHGEAVEHVNNIKFLGIHITV